MKQHFYKPDYSSDGPAVNNGFVRSRVEVDGASVEIVEIDWSDPGLIIPEVPEFHLSHLLWSTIGREKIRWCLPNGGPTLPTGRVSVLEPNTSIVIQHDKGKACYIVCRIDVGYFQHIARANTWPTEWIVRALTADSPLIRAIMDRLAGEVAAPDARSPMFISSVLVSLLLEIQRIASRPASSAAENPPVDEKFDNLVQLIDAPNGGTLSIKQLANHVGMSVDQLRRRFRDVRGTSLHTYIADGRMRKAKTLLADSSKSLKAISAEAGFSSPSYFSSIIRQNLGCRPSEYRAFIQASRGA